jgi:hypothetical protein
VQTILQQNAGEPEHFELDALDQAMEKRTVAR